MAEQKMTIHRALSELKIINSRIENQLNEFIPVGIRQLNKPVDGKFQSNEFESDAQSKYQSITDLIERKQKIKRAIVKANGETKVTVAGIEMTIADAITQKSTIDLKKSLLLRMKTVLGGPGQA